MKRNSNAFSTHSSVVEVDRITELFRDGKAIQAALQSAVDEALQEHKRAGNPIAVWRDEKVVWIPPEEI